MKIRGSVNIGGNVKANVERNKLYFGEASKTDYFEISIEITSFFLYHKGKTRQPMLQISHHSVLFIAFGSSCGHSR